MLLKKRRRGKNDKYKKFLLFESDSIMIICYVSLSECFNIIVNVIVFVMILFMFVVCVYFRIWMINLENIDVFMIFFVVFYLFIIIVCFIVFLF